MLSQIRTQKQHFNVLPQQIQLLKLFHLNTQELQRRIQSELNDNPLLEETMASEEDTDIQNKDTVQDYQDEEEYQYNDIPDYKLEHNNYLSDQNLPQRPIVERFDIRNDLKQQLPFLLTSARSLDFANYLIDSVNENGLLEHDEETLIDDYSFKSYTVIESEEFAHIRSVIKNLEPSGVGCFTIQEFLLLQLGKMNPKRPDVKKAICLLDKHFSHFNCKTPEQIAKLLRIDEDELQIVLDLLRSCRTKPFTEIEISGSHASIIPDFIIKRDGDCFEISLYRQRSATLFVNHSISASLGTRTRADKGVQQYMKGKLLAAQWFVDAIKQREGTMQKVMRVLVELQCDYFQQGDIAKLKPMILKNVADRTGVDISTISRITCNKYADTHFGTILLKDLFSEGIENDLGESISNRVIQSAIAEVVKNEDKEHLLTDRELVSILSAKGFNIARRTVAKYREQLRIPPAQVRALWAF